MFWVALIHRWTGAFLGLLLAALGLSGTLLLFKDAWLRATVPHAAEARVADTAAITAIERLMADPLSRPTGVLLPTDSLGVFRLTFPDDAGAYADQTGAIVTRWSSKWERSELWLFDLHHHLWMGEPGATTGGILGLIGMGFTVTGLLLWWRSRRSFALRLIPEGLSRSQIVRHHRDLGMLASPFLIVTLLTGAMLTLRPVADFLFWPMSPPGTIAQSLAPPQAKGGAMTASFDWRPTLAEVKRRYPQAELRGISIPTGRDGLIRIRARQPHEWLPNGRTLFWVDPADGRFVDVVDARSLPLAARAFNIVYPVHAATVGGFIYQAAMTIAGLALTLLGTLAVYGFWRHRVNAMAAATTTPYRARSGSR
ncbi:MAG: PepSY-associated TM helix domain-containing protein [Steroidobacteraceae bacterium]